MSALAVGAIILSTIAIAISVASLYLARQKRARSLRVHDLLAEDFEVRAILAAALGYANDPDYGWVTGDHTTVTIAIEAARRIGETDGPLTSLRGYREGYLRGLQDAVERLDAIHLDDAGLRAGYAVALAQIVKLEREQLAESHDDPHPDRCGDPE